ncbi:translocon-associated protein subunit alpha [Ischnura elegans]|uniref:translocon-associated protein subunit alpha n=1 Tax=Ischnura elegans TaxID=197161 RepID=UPI001ED89503|nr:translocon-associated protein subunit alpha [Ischnura elegans]
MQKSVLFCLLLSGVCLVAFCTGPTWAADVVEDEVEDEVDVEGEETAVTEEEEEEEADGSGSAPRASPDAHTTILFTKPVHTAASTALELPGGNVVELLIGFSNKGQQDFILEAVDASFRYPMDFAFHIQNYSTIAYNKVVAPSHEATLAYSFIPSEAFAGRPFGLSVNLHYRDSLSGAVFKESVYNETVQVVEVEEGLDGETFFLYVFLAACAVLMLVAGQQLLASSVGRSGAGAGSRRAAAGLVNSLRGKGQHVETGTSKQSDVDYDWVPVQTLNNMSKSPKAVKQSPKQSPRQRKAKRTAGSDD